MARMQQIESLFHEALSLPDGEDRIQWLDRRCQSDRELFTEVSSLLESHAEMSSPEVEEEAQPELAMPAGQFGAYRPVKLIGRGGAHVRCDLLLGDRPDGRSMGEQRGLRVVGLRQFLGRTFERERTELRSKCGVGTIPDVPSGRKSLGDILAHAGLLRALAGKQQENFQTGNRSLVVGYS